jgi:hypothetical protein
MKCSKSGKLQHEDVTVVVWHDNFEVFSTKTDARTDDNVLKKWLRGRSQNSLSQSCGELHTKLWGH